MTDQVVQGTVLRTLGLGHRFADGPWAFRDVNLALRAGEITVLAGRNGAGKSLLAKHLAGLLTPTEGSILIEGQVLASIKGCTATHVGYVFLDARLQTVGETVLDDTLFGPTNLVLPHGVALERAENALRSCGLAEKTHSFVHKLSGGELRCLAIAGVLAMMPRVIILDEPFANLDPEGIKRILELIRSLADGKMAVLVVTHEIEKVLGLAKNFAIMDSGRIALSGTPSEVLEKGIESYGLRNPFRPQSELRDLAWL